jgi:small subunit ribosomal protein S8
VLLEENYLMGVDVIEAKGKEKKTLALKLKYENKKPAITDIKQVSKTSLRVYLPYRHLPKVLGGLGTSVISTPKGVVSTRQAKKLHMGGEIICNVW